MAQNPLTGSEISAVGSEATIPINMGSAADLLLSFPDALLPHCDKKTIGTLRLVCTTTRDAIYSRTRGLIWDGAVSHEAYHASQTVFSKCPNLDRVQGCSPYTYLALASLPTHLTALEVKPYQILDAVDMDEELTLVDLSPLTKLTGLREAKLHGLPYSSIANLDFGDALRSLDICSSDEMDIIPVLGVLPSLNSLSVSREHATGLDDISALSACSNLHTLTLYVGYLMDISALSRCTNLHVLYMSLSGGLLEDISALAACQNLHTLSVFSDELHDISALSACPKLHTLTLHRMFEDISALPSCSKLHTLTLSSCELKDISALSACPNLHTLSLGGVFEDISALSSCCNLHTLCLDGGECLDVSFLSECSNLHTLSLSESLTMCGGIIQNISALTACSNLDTLTLCRVNAEGIEAPSECPVNIVCLNS